MKTNTMIQNAPQGEQPWWFVRTPLLVAFAVLALALVLAAMLTPTPLNEWVFGENIGHITRR